MKILLIHGNCQNAELICQGLIKSHYQVFQTSNHQIGLQSALNDSFHLIIVDVELPSADGLSILSELQAQGIQTPVLVLSPQHAIESLMPYLATGGNDFLLKSATVIELRARVKTLLRRATAAVSEPERIALAGVTIDLNSREAFRDQKKIKLQKNEFELLEFLIRNAGKVVTKSQILQQIWDYNFDPQTNIVDVLVWRLRAKIDKHFPNKVIQTVRGVGYTFRPA